MPAREFKARGGSFWENGPVAANRGHRTLFSEKIRLGAHAGAHV